MVVNILLFLLCVLETLQHLSYPINFCNMASTCIHDSRLVCASSPDGCSRKSFLDQCDMYEYNCDYGTQYMTKVTSSCTSDYQETYILFCGAFMTPTQFTQIHSSMTKDPTSNGISKSSAKQLPEILSHDDKTDINPSTVPLNLSTSTPVTTSVINISKESDANIIDNHQTIPVYCCNRPLTWETTTEVTHIYEDIPIINNSDENIQTKTSTEYSITDLYNQTTIHENENHITFTTINQQTSDTVPINDTTLFENTESDEALDKKLTPMDIVDQSSPDSCCNRSQTQDTTTEVTQIYKDIPIKNNSDVNKQTETPIKYNATDILYNQTTIYENENSITFTTMNQQISDTVTIDDTTLFENTETDEAPDKKLSVMEIVDQTSTVYCCNRPLTWETTTEVTKVFEDTKIENNNSVENQTDKIVNEKHVNYDKPMQTITDTTYTTDIYTKDTSRYSTTYATPMDKKLNLLSQATNKCNNKCQRPFTWLTTTKRRKRF